MLYPKEWLKYKNTCGERWIIETLKVMSRSDQIISSRLEVTEDPYWGVVPVNHYISPILHNQINLESNVLYILLD